MALNDGKEKKGEEFSQILRHRVRELGISSPRKLSGLMNTQYDPLRKVYNGERFPGPKLLKVICNYLDLDLEEMRALVNMDKALDKGWAPAELVEAIGEDKTLLKFSTYWASLPEDDKQELMDLAKGKADRASKRSQAF